MSKQAKKDHWIIKFAIFAVILLVICVTVGKSVDMLSNVLAVIYIFAGLYWFTKHLKVSDDSHSKQ